MFPSCVTLRARAGVMRLLASRVDSSGAIQLGAEFAKTIQPVPTGLAARNRGTEFCTPYQGNCASCSSFFRTSQPLKLCVEEADGGGRSSLLIQDKSRMREFRSYGSVRGVPGNRHPYRAHAPVVPGRNRVFADELFFCVFNPGPPFRSCQCTSKRRPWCALFRRLVWWANI